MLPSLVWFFADLGLRPHYWGHTQGCGQFTKSVAKTKKGGGYACSFGGGGGDLRNAGASMSQRLQHAFRRCSRFLLLWLQGCARNKKIGLLTWPFRSDPLTRGGYGDFKPMISTD